MGKLGPVYDTSNAQQSNKYKEMQQEKHLLVEELFKLMKTARVKQTRSYPGPHIRRRIP